MLKKTLVLFAKISFLFFSVYLLTYYLIGLYLASIHDILSLHQIWIGAIMILLIFINVKFIQWETQKWKKRQ